MNRCVLLISCFCLIPASNLIAEIELPLLFRDGMVLQRDTPVRIYGRASNGATISIRLNGQQKTAMAKNGTWSAMLDPMPAGGPYKLQINGDSSEITISDVMLGEVWLAGGQSNMQMSLSSTSDFEKYLPAGTNSRLRFVSIPVTEFGEIDGDKVTWHCFDPDSARKFSAVAFYFARELQKRLGVTIGIIGSYRGSTNNEYWMTPESIKGSRKLRHYFERYEDACSEYEIRKERLILWNDKIMEPKYVRYAYSPNPDMVLFNLEGLPATPFTTE